MKKLYTIIFLLIIGAAGIFIIFSRSTKIQLGENFTPEEYWKYQYEVKKEKRKKGYSKADKPNEFTKYFKAITTPFGQEESKYPFNYKMNEFEKAQARKKHGKTNEKESPVWEQRGPANVGGRTRGLIIDPDDVTHKTWFAGAATGGVWKTTDGGANWTCLTDNFPNLSANTLAIAASNTQVIYAGTGESFPGGTYLKGSGIFKSIDKGDTWTQLASTASDANFNYVNRLTVDPNNEEIVIAATESGIMKSIDGGNSWTKVYRSSLGVEDLKADTTNFNLLYATENSIGVVKSTDAGDNWIVSSTGIASGNRFELAISPVNTAKIYLSANVSETSSYIYRSVDYGNTWVRFDDKNDANQNFLGGQGTYDNTIVAHPYNENIAFLGGVNLWKVDFGNPGTNSISLPMVTRVDQNNTLSFLTFVNFGGSFLGGGMETGDKNNATNLVSADWSSVEVRFGPGITQKAHRFTVGGIGAGVPVTGYIYRNYVDVPFQVWDTKNNRQLMVSFRDQDEDGKFNLYDRTGLPDSQGREYLFINAVPYSATTASADIAKIGGHAYKQLYFFWPTLLPGASWDDANLPISNISINYGSINLTKGTTTNVSDAYGSISGNNTYNQNIGMGRTAIPGLHPDHHAMEIVPINQSRDSFLIINGNDGGLAISKNSGITFNQLPNNYITTQFYGAAKKPGENEFIGGMQDNGTWRSQAGQSASITSNYLFQIGGDGFECVWNYGNPSKIIGSVYNNSFYRTINGGSNWTSGSTGITVDDGPFISRLSSHKNTPENLYAVGKDGIYKSTNFAASWVKKAVGAGWLGTGITEVTSQHNIEVSLANENIIWAGAAMSATNGWKLFISKDRGESFKAVNEFSGISGYISGIATHPYNDSIAYILFSLPGQPKVIRTTNMGQSWEDISGFYGKSESTNGFPDVVTHSLVVLPHDPSTIWVGTDIGLFESNDNGETWHFSDNGLPAVSVYDMFVQDDKVVIATHGRGIWTASFAELSYLPELSALTHLNNTLSAQVKYNTSYDSVQVYLNNSKYESIQNVTAGTSVIQCTITSQTNSKIHLIGFKDSKPYQSNIVRIFYETLLGLGTGLEVEKLKIYPNPSNGLVNIDLPSSIIGNSTVDIYTLSGSKVYSQILNESSNQLNLQHLNTGIYLIRLNKDGIIYTEKIQIRK
ncbi:MAG: hypothetical protein A2W99_02635 [Bacteroidetes bacterium GWF2_33_16]|nr:MAG: hypothetical protein A2X00_15520 [Bacteroidetes bacterium GWE2_32_14]OFY07158.1 MAG: hypothetical protein A2W99_02635 [Bacteroidetes bacterium GWF2_33_16]